MSINGFLQIALRELPTWMKVFRIDGVNDKMEILEDLTLIDDLLVLQKSQSLLRRKKNLRAQMDARIGFEVNKKRNQ